MGKKELPNTGNRGGQPTLQKQLDNKKRCAEAFNKGWGIMFAAEKLHLNWKTIESYYKELREDLMEKIDSEFITNQKTAKEMGIRALDFEIEKVDDMINDKDHGIQMRVIEDPENPAWLAQLKSAIELRSNLKQQRYSLEMSPTIDVSIDNLVSEMREQSDEIK